MTAVNLLGASFSIVPEDAFITHEVDKSTFLHKTGSMATSLHLRQTLDILKCKENIIHTTAALITGLPKECENIQVQLQLCEHLLAQKWYR